MGDLEGFASLGNKKYDSKSGKRNARNSMRTKNRPRAKERRDDCDIIVQMLNKFKMRGVMGQSAPLG